MLYFCVEKKRRNVAFKKREVFEREQYSVVASGREEHTQASYHSQSPTALNTNLQRSIKAYKEG